jgi:predicted phosphoadenosine phosphosulfate sulfurtransferase
MEKTDYTGRHRREYLDIDVLESAKRRIKHIFDVFDSVVVCFSGGKDSLATLHLVKEEAERRGEKQVNVIFRDEEVIPQIVIDFVDKYRQKDWINMIWFAVPLKSTKYILGKTFEYVQWDANRAWTREKPEWSIKGDGTIYDQYSMDNYTATFFKGRIALVNGIRADESLKRYASCVAKINENYINSTKCPTAFMCKPIYDWRENDIFKYFYQEKIEYNPWYNIQHVGNHNLRIATPLHAENAKKFDLLRTLEPEYYQQVINVFPEMIVQEKYYSQLDRKADEKIYSQSIETLYQYIDDKFEDVKQAALARERLNGIERARVNKPENYPINEIFNYLRRGVFKSRMLPVKLKK